MSLTAILKGGKGKHEKGYLNTTTGVMGRAFRGAGVGVAVNWVDKKMLAGKATATGFTLTQLPMINGKAICFNGTDAATALAVVGFKPSIGWAVAALGAVALKKAAELYDILDPPVNTPMGQTTTTIAYPTSNGMGTMAIR